MPQPLQSVTVCVLDSWHNLPSYDGPHDRSSVAQLVASRAFRDTMRLQSGRASAVSEWAPTLRLVFGPLGAKWVRSVPRYRTSFGNHSEDAGSQAAGATRICTCHDLCNVSVLPLHATQPRHTGALLQTQAAAGRLRSFRGYFGNMSHSFFNQSNYTKFQKKKISGLLRCP